MMTNEAAVDQRIAELEADVRRLRRLLDQKDAPGELRHRLRGTLALLRTIIRKSAATPRELEEYIGHLEDRMDTLGRAQAVIDEHGTVDLHRLLADEFLHYGASEGERVTLSGPEVELQPRSGQAFAIAVHELAVNALEYGALDDSRGTIDVSWAVELQDVQPCLSLIWKESGVVLPDGDRKHGFGTEVLTRMLAYELKAVTQMDFEPDGLRCAIRFPLSANIGAAVAR